VPRTLLSCFLLAFAAGPLVAAPDASAPDLKSLAAKYDLELVTASPRFPVQLRAGLIDGEKAPRTELESYLRIFAFEWSLYPPELVKRAGLKKVVFCQRLSFEKQFRTGIPDFENDVLYLDVTKGRGSDLYVRKVIHHEFFHIVDLRDDGKLYEDDRWCALNPPGFKYGPGGARLQHDPTVTLTGKDEPGFLNRYATAGVEEDKADVFAHMIVEPKMIAERASKDAYVKAKVERMTELLASFSASMDKTFWESVSKTERSRPGPGSAKDDKPGEKKPDTKTFQLKVTVNRDEKPLSAKYTTFELKNTGDTPFEIKTGLSGGLTLFLDNEVIDPSGTRITEKFHLATVSSPYSFKARVVATVPAGKSLTEPVDVFYGVPREKLAPGKYKCKFLFRYDDGAKVYEAASETIEVQLTKDDLDKR
jgi:hypothetical protein